MRRLVAVLLLPAWLAAAGGWTSFRYGPLSVETEADGREGRQVLNTLVQLRWMLAQRLGRQEIEPVWPVRVLLFKKTPAKSPYLDPGIRLRRDAYTSGLVSGAPLPPQLLRDFTLILLGAAANRLPESMESGIAAVFSTFQADGTRVTLGLPPEPETRDKAWAAMHMALVDDAFSGRARVLFSVLGQGAGLDAATRNAFQMSHAQWEARVEQYFAAGAYASAQTGGAPVNPERDFRRREVDPVLAAIHLADLLPAESARPAYQAVLNKGQRRPEAFEGLEMYKEAVEAGSESAAAWLAWAGQQSAIAEARASYSKAAELNPRWALPYAAQAAREEDPGRQAGLLQKAVSMAPGNSTWWRDLARALLALNRFDEAGAAYREAERSAPNEEERERLRSSLRAFEDEKRQKQEAERLRREEQERQELEQLKQKALSNIREAEERARQAAGPGGEPRKVVEWWDDARPRAKAAGTLETVDCLRGTLRLRIRGEDGKPLALLIPDPSKVVVVGEGEQTLGCGPQKPPRRLTVEYHPGVDKKYGTTGEAALIEFRP